MFTETVELNFPFSWTFTSNWVWELLHVSFFGKFLKASCLWENVNSSLVSGTFQFIFGLENDLSREDFHRRWPSWGILGSGVWESFGLREACSDYPNSLHLFFASCSILQSVLRNTIKDEFLRVFLSSQVPAAFFSTNFVQLRVAVSTTIQKK